MQYAFVETNLKLEFRKSEVGNLVRGGVNLSADDGAWVYVNLTIVVRPPTAQTRGCAGLAVMAIGIVSVRTSGRKVVVVVVNRSSMLGPFAQPKAPVDRSRGIVSMD